MNAQPVAIRNFQWHDLPALVNFMNEHNADAGNSARVTIDQIERSWRAPYNHPERDAFVAVQADGSLLGYAIADLLDEPNYAYGVYHAFLGHRDAAHGLMQAVTQHFLTTALAQSAPDVPITLDWRLSPHDHEALALCAEQGFEQVRQFYTMRIDLDGAVAPTALPAGLTLKPFTPPQLPAVYQAKTEIFADHWGGQYDSLQEWQDRIAQPHFDPTLWWIAYADDAIVGMVLSETFSDVSASIGIVGVQRAWRKRGVAQALLMQCLAEYQRRGFRQLELGVDSTSATNAVALYERVGMHIHNTILYYRHQLRGG